MFLALGLSLLLGAPYAAGENWIENPGLEDTKSDDPDSPRAWPRSIKRGPGANPTYEWVEAGRTGRMGLRCEVEGQFGVFAVPTKPEFEPDPGSVYRFSFWYRTEGGEPEGKAVHIGARRVGAFQCPTSPEWTRARYFLDGGSCSNQLQAYVAGLKGGRWGWKKDEDGDYEKDKQGRRLVTNALKVVAFLDDFELRRVTGHDLEGNLFHNGGFEEGRPPHMAPGAWQTYQAWQTASLDDEVSHSGKQSLRVHCRKGAAMRCAWVPARPGDICTWSFWAKSNVASVPLYLRISTNGRDNLQPHQWFTDKKATVGLQWQKVEFMAIIPGKDDPDYDPGTSLACCTLHYRAKDDCQIWIDDSGFVIEDL